VGAGSGRFFWHICALLADRRCACFEKVESREQAAGEVHSLAAVVSSLTRFHALLSTHYFLRLCVWLGWACCPNLPHTGTGSIIFLGVISPASSADTPFSDNPISFVIEICSRHNKQKIEDLQANPACSSTNVIISRNQAWFKNARFAVAASRHVLSRTPHDSSGGTPLLRRRGLWPRVHQVLPAIEPGQ